MKGSIVRGYRNCLLEPFYGLFKIMFQNGFVRLLDLLFSIHLPILPLKKR
jgi:hypothetical protein